MSVNVGGGIVYGLRLFTGGKGAGGERGSRRKGGFHFAGTIIGIGFCLIPLVLVMEVTSGMISGITDRYLEIGTFHIQARNYLGTDPSTVEAAVAKAQAIPGVREVVPFNEGGGLLWAGGKTRGVTVRGYPQRMVESDEGFMRYFTIEEGKADLSTPDSIILSAGLAKQLGVGTGDAVKLVVSRDLGGGRYVFRPEKLTVSGVFSTGYRELDSMTAIVPREKAESLFRDAGSFSVGIKVEDPYGDMSGLVRSLEDLFPRNWHFHTWYELEKPMYKSFQTTRSLLTFIMGIIMLVGIFNISAALTMAVLEKQQEIAVLKGIGVDTGTIVIGFLFAGFLCGLIGTVWGISAGLLLSVNINELLRGLDLLFSRGGGSVIPKEYYLERIPVTVNWARTGIVAAVSLALSVLASILPAIKGAGLSVMEVMRRV